MKPEEQMNHSNKGDSIAIIGMGGRFPSADLMDTFWMKVSEGFELIRDLSDDELLDRGVSPELLKNGLYVKRSPDLGDIDQFDAAFFGYTPREAELMDPQQRIFLECAWQLLEVCGYLNQSDNIRIGISAGSSLSSYLLNNIIPSIGIEAAAEDVRVRTGNDKDFLATRVAYKCNLKGPAISINTACSTSLVAIWKACEEIRAGNADMMLAGGISVTTPEGLGYLYQEGGIASPDGVCRPFDENGRGTIGGNGCGIVMLKKLSSALRDGDPVHAVILGGAVNNDGSDKIGFTAPSVSGQKEVIEQALNDAGIDAGSVGYIETHGTGTTLGDPIELQALHEVYCRQPDKKDEPLYLGSVKANIGHLDAAAGVAGLIKAALSLSHKTIPPLANFSKPNPQFDFENSRFQIPTAPLKWDSVKGQKRRASVSSFGLGGTNAHIILEEAPVIQANRDSGEPVLFRLSARSEDSVQKLRNALALRFKQNPDLSLSDAAYTLSAWREEYSHRFSFAARDHNEVIQKLQNSLTPDHAGSPPVTAFAFPGQGTHYQGMIQNLYKIDSGFKHDIDRCSQIIKSITGHELLDLLFNDQTPEEALQQLDVSPAVQFAVSYSIANWWKNHGVLPSYVIGHSFGEYVAACFSGLFSIEDGLKLVIKRGLITQKLPKGSMMAIAVGEPEARKLASEYGLSLATVNSDSQCVLSGSDEAVDRICDYCETNDIFNRKLKISYASHSEIIDLIADEYREIVSTVTFHKPQIPIISNLTGKLVSDDEIMQADYWVNHMRYPVLFANGLKTLDSLNCEMVIETGPGDTLNKLILQSKSVTGIRSIPSLGKNADEEVITLYESLGKMWSLGSNIDWNNWGTDTPQKADLPPTPFVHSSYWMDAPDPAQFTGSNTLTRSGPDLKQKESDTDQWFYYPEWKRVVPPPVSQAAGDSSILIIGQVPDKIQKIENLLNKAGLKTETVRLINRSSSEKNEIVIDQPADYDRLRSIIPDNCNRIIYLPPEEAGQPTIALNSLLFTAQSLSVLNNRSIKFVVITEQSQIVTGSEELNLMQAGISGSLKVLDQEHQHISCRMIDIESVDTIDKLIFRQELLAEESPFTVAIRGSHRWILNYRQLMKSELPPSAEILKNQGTYLITGGLGNVGLLLADLLRREYDANVILTGRTPVLTNEDIQKWKNGIMTDRFKSTQCVSPLDITLDDVQREMQSGFDAGIAELKKTTALDHKKFNELSNELCGRFLLESVLEIVSEGQTFDTIDSFKKALKPVTAYERYADFVIQTLIEDGYLVEQQDETNWKLQVPKQASSAEKLKDLLLDEFPGFKSQMDIVEKSATHGMEVMRGLKNGVEVLFSGQSDENNNSEAPESRIYFDLYSQLLKNQIEKLIKANPERKIRMIEIGAGNGLLTDTLVRDLNGQNIEYTFTDIGHTFVRNAQKKYSGAGYNFMKFQTFDISQSPVDQDLPQYAYDLVFGLNVVHATPDLCETLAHLRSLLRPGGLLGLIETVKSERWDSMIWGLTPEWWSFTDTQYRTKSPLISADAWKEAFENCHYNPVSVIPENQDLHPDCDSAMIIGQQPMDLNPFKDPAYNVFINEKTGQAIRKMERLNRVQAHKGRGEVITEQADVSDRKAMHGVIQRAKEKYGSIDGVIHAAGVVSGDSIFTFSTETTALDIQKQHEPKAEGLNILNDLLAGEPLDFCLLLSSNASVIGGLGLTAYASANAYMDQFVASKNGKLPYICSNWDGWPNEENQIDDETDTGPSSSISYYSMTLPEAEQIFKRIISMPQMASQISVSSGPLQHRLDKWVQKDRDAFTTTPDSNGQDDKVKKGNRPNLATAFEPAQTRTEKGLEFIWSNLLGIQPIGIHDNFFELNGDSLLGTQLISRVNQKFNLHLPLRSLFEDLTLFKMAERIDSVQQESHNFQLLPEEEEYEEGEL